ncbi:hypothetical protein Tco_1474499 [Tanacetum coccineum]
MKCKAIPNKDNQEDLRWMMISKKAQRSHKPKGQISNHYIMYKGHQRKKNQRHRANRQKGQSKNGREEEKCVPWLHRTRFLSSLECDEAQVKPLTQQMMTLDVKLSTLAAYNLVFTVDLVKPKKVAPYAKEFDKPSCLIERP